LKEQEEEQVVPVKKQVQTPLYAQNTLYQQNQLMSILKPNKLISLGYNCYFKLYLNTIKINQETHLFDYIGTSMWTILEILFNNINFLDKKDFELLTIENQITPSNSKYYIRFRHDLNCKLSNFKKMKTKYLRRHTRFINMLNSSDPIIFFRIQESMSTRVILPQHKDFYEKNELEYINQFISKVNLIHKTTFKLIYFSYTHNTSIVNNQLLILHTDKEIDNCWQESPLHINNIMFRNYGLIKQFVKL